MSVREKVADILRDGFTPGYEQPADEVAGAAIRAVLEAMREPSEGLYTLGARSIRDTMGTDNFTERSQRIWRAMLEQWAKEQGLL